MNYVVINKVVQYVNRYKSNYFAFIFSNRMIPGLHLLVLSQQQKQ